MKMILDVDTGIDDALAISYAIGNNVDLIGICTSFGNVYCNEAAKNTLDLLHLLGKDDIPVYMGANNPWEKEYHRRPMLFKIHGDNGIGNVELESSPNKPEEMSAPDFMIESAKKYGQELTIVTLGPLTNLADAIKKDHDAINGINKIVIMGGALTVPGNCTPYAEANIYEDRLAAKYVLESGIQTIICGLDATLKTFIKGKDIESWNSDSKIGKALVGMCEYYYTNEMDEDDVGGAMHDPLAVDIAINPDVVTDLIPINLTVNLVEPTEGMTIGDPWLLTRKKKDSLVISDIDEETFIKRFVETIKQMTK